MPTHKEGGRAEARNMLSAMAKSPWDGKPEPFVGSDVHLGKAVGMLSLPG